MRDDPLIHAINVVRNYNIPMKRSLNSFISDNIDDVQRDLDEIKDNVSNSTSSKMQFYKLINPDCYVHSIYDSNVKVNELERISWTRMRVSAHSLAIESGRWNRRGRCRLPIEERVCTCGLVLTEQNVIEACPRTAQLRNQYNYSTVGNIFNMSDYALMCKIAHRILSEYQ